MSKIKITSILILKYYNEIQLWRFLVLRTFCMKIKYWYKLNNLMPQYFLKSDSDLLFKNIDLLKVKMSSHSRDR